VPPLATHQLDAMAYPPSDWDAIVEVRRRLARELLEEAVSTGEGIETAIVDDDPGVALCDASRNGDLLILGSRHWGPLARIVLGGTGEYVTRHAHSAVLMVPRRETDAPATRQLGQTASAS
jgi:nucleotide-binding universal stress UspA family protein